VVKVIIEFITKTLVTHRTENRSFRPPTVVCRRFPRIPRITGIHINLSQSLEETRLPGLYFSR